MLLNCFPGPKAKRTYFFMYFAKASVFVALLVLIKPVNTHVRMNNGSLNAGGIDNG
jgi:hypothetical protein